MRHTVTIDGMNFSTIDEFWDEMDQLLTKNRSWKTGHNMDAFHDLLRGGFGVHEVGEGIDFYWINVDKSHQDLGYEAAALYWEKIFQKCHPTNRQAMMLKIKAAKACEGKTLFDMIVDEILDKNVGTTTHCSSIVNIFLIPIYWEDGKVSRASQRLR